MTEHTTRLRADARRNREQIIVAAREVFLEQGIHAPLEEIARRAAVGIATLYRRFPERSTLVREVALDNLALVEQELDQAIAAHADAWGALVRLLHRLVELRATVLMPMLAPELEAQLRADGGTLRERREEVYRRMEQLTMAAQRDGQLRQGITPVDLWLALVKLSRPMPVIGVELNDLITGQQLELFIGGLRAVELDRTEPLRRRPLTLDELDRLFQEESE